MLESIFDYLFGEGEESIDDEYFGSDLPTKRIENLWLGWEKKPGLGEITGFENENFGLIDDKYSFDLSMRLPNSLARPFYEIGDTVEFLLGRESEHKEWIIVRIISLKKNNLLPFVQNGFIEEIAKISHLDSEILKIHFSLNETKIEKVLEISTFQKILEKKYSPLVGDYLSVRLKFKSWKNDMESAEICSLRPNRERIAFKGKVTKSDPYDDYIVIDREVIYYTENDTRNFGRNYRVEYNAVECEFTYHYCQWRATSVKNQENKMISDPLPPALPPSLSHKLDEFGEIKSSVQLQNFILFENLKIDDRIEKKFEIFNRGQMNITLSNITLVDDRFSNFEVVKNGKESWSIKPSESLVFSILAHGNNPGFNEVLLHIDLDAKTYNPEYKWAKFTLLKSYVSVSEENDVKMSYDRSQATANIKFANSISDFHVYTTRPPNYRWVTGNRLKYYDIPKYFYDDAINLSMNEFISSYTDIAKPLDASNYAIKLHALVFLEEITSREKIKRYSMLRASFKREMQNLVLDVPGLSEKKPSLILGDGVLVHDLQNEKSFKGRIIEVRQREVVIEFPEIFLRNFSDITYSVTFQSSRGSYKSMHRAIETVEQVFGPNYLFPPLNFLELKPPYFSDTSISSQIYKHTETIKREPQNSIPQSNQALKDFVSPVYSFDFKKVLSPMQIKVKRFLSPPFKYQFSSTQENSSKFPTYVKAQSSKFKKESFQIPLNKEQKAAVQSICNACCRPLPYILFGPPGTGKTVTLVAAILEIIKYKKDARILVTAPSNAATNTIAYHLINLGKLAPGTLARVLPFSYTGIIDEEYKDFFFKNTEEYKVLDKLTHFQIIVMSCNGASYFYSLKSFARNHFSHLFIDEAGQCSEPNSLVPLALMAPQNNGQVVLAGDPQQIGPTLFSKLATELGLGKSLIERLLTENKLYSPDPIKFKDHYGNYDPILVTKLVRNYRNHPDILKIPSELFYKDELLPCADSEAYRFIGDKDILINPNHPIIFHGVRGIEEQNPDSPSWFNVSEIIMVQRYVQKLYNKGISPSSILIITPYTKQTEKICDHLDDNDIPLPYINTINGCQGSEMMVIIISTVRSLNRSESEAMGDASQGIGIVYSSRRFNVALTRAKALLIVIGNPHALYQDPSWTSFMKYCLKLGVFTGCDIPSQLHD